MTDYTSLNLAGLTSGTARVENTPTSTNTSEITLNMTAAAAGTSTYVPFTYPSSLPTYNWTFSNPSYTLAELTERQMGDLEERMARVVRRELATLFSLVVQGLEDMDDDDEEGDDEA